MNTEIQQFIDAKDEFGPEFVYVGIPGFVFLGKPVRLFLAETIMW